jgi:hypothetical protein
LLLVLPLGLWYIVVVGSRCLVGAAALAVFVGVGAAAAAVSPARLVSAALAKAHAQRSVHYVSSQASNGRAVTIVGDAATDRGVQHITFRRSGRVGHVTVLVVSNTAFIRGDAFTLTNYMGIPASAAAAWAGKWLSLAKSAPDYPTVSAAVRLGSTLDEVKMPPPFRTLGTSTRHGRRVVGIVSHFEHAGRTVTATLYVDTARSLPVEQVDRSGGITVTATFSRWNERVSVSPPASAIAIR